MSHVSQWMSWQDGVDLSALTSADFQTPNVIVHLGRMVSTPVGNAPAGMIFWQPDPTIMPAVMGFVCSDKDVGKYFGSHIFSDTPYEHIPVLNATINVRIDSDRATSTCIVGGYQFEVEVSDFSDPQLISREPGTATPFWQQGIEMICSKTILRINGNEVDIIIPPVGKNGGPASVVAPLGVYAR